MPSQSSHPDYDANLLASAPVATKAQLQSGYNPDLLAEKGTPPSSRNDLETRGRSPVERIDDEHPTPIPPKVPYYRTRKGIITIVVVLVVIIAVAVGGGVAGSRKTLTKSSSSQDASANGTATANNTISGITGSTDDPTPFTSTRAPTSTLTTTATSTTIANGDTPVDIPTFGNTFAPGSGQTGI